MNLFRADLFRLVRDKSLYIFAAILTALSTLICLVYYFLSKNSSSATEISKVILQCADLGILSTLTGIAVSLYNGKDFTNNTIRNKIGCGESRYKVFFVKLLENYLLAIVFFAISVGVSAAIGSFLFEHTLLAGFWKQLFCQLALLIGFISVISAVVNTTKSMKVSIILTVALFVVLNALATMIPTLSDGAFVKILCRSVYMIVSNMMVPKFGGGNFGGAEIPDGTYVANIGMTADRQLISVTYDNLYLNAIIIAIVYTAVAITVTLLVLRKQDYK